MKQIELLKSQNAVITVLVVALLAQMPHAEAVFYTHGQSHDWLGRAASIFAAIALELAVLVFVVRGSIRASWGFALFSVAINLVYYYRADATLADLAPTLLLSAGLPIAIALYSHEVAEPVHSAPQVATVKRTKAIATPVQEVATFEQVIDKTMQAQFERDMQAIDDAAQAEVAGIDKRQRAMQLKSEGLSNATIAQELQVNPSTVSRWFKKVEA
jgi:hypothetical protein